MGWNGHFIRIPVRIIVYGMPDQSPGRFQSVVRIKSHVHGTLCFCNIRCGYHPGVIMTRNFRKAGHAALHIRDHHLDSPCDDGQLLLQKIAGNRDAVAHQDFIGRAADACQIDPAFGAFFPGLGDQLRIPGGNGQHFREFRFMTMNDDIHGVFFEHAQVGITPHRRRRAKQNIGCDGRDPGSAPAVRKRSTKCKAKEVFIIVIHTHVSPMQGLDNCPVNAKGQYFLTFPDTLLFERGQHQGLQNGFLGCEFS